MNDRWRNQVYRWSDDLLRSDLPSTAKVVGMRLAVSSLKSVHPEEIWWRATRPHLAESCGLSVKALQRALGDLEHAGVLVIKRGSGRQHSTYRLAREGTILNPQRGTRPTPSALGFAISDRVDEINAGALGDDLRSIRDLPETEEP
jgi:hypothetical protein